ALGATLQPPRRICEDEVCERREHERVDEEADREGERAVRLRERPEERRQRNPDQQQPGVVVRPPQIRDEPAHEERPAEDEPEGDHDRLLVLVIGEQRQRDGDQADDDADDPVDDGRAPGAHPWSSAEIAAPDSSSLATKPRAPDCSTSEPKSASSRLDVRTTCARMPLRERRLATSNPSMSGSWMSRSTTSGCRRSTAATAETPSAASPTTWKPSSSRSVRAVARKLGWSSTMRTVLIRPSWQRHAAASIRLTAPFVATG